MNRRNNSTSKRKIAVVILTALLVILLFWLVLRFVVGKFELDEQFGDSGEWGGEAEQTELTIGDTDYVSDDNINAYLIIGTDAGGEDLGKEYRGTLADFLALLLIDNTIERFAIVQIDRNTMIDIQVVDEEGNYESMGEQQICLAHWYGENDNQRNNNTVLNVSELLGGLEIDDYYTINMADMDKINNAIGGVVVDIEEDMTSLDPAFVKGSSVHLQDGQAEKFVRARVNIGDESNKARMRRQRQYMQKAYSMVMDQLRENPEYVNDLYDQLKDDVQTSSSGGDLSRLTNHMLQYENSGILEFEGKTKLGDTQGDSIEHEEFYINQESIVTVLSKVINLSKGED